jgi:hypothetical protein
LKLARSRAVPRQRRRRRQHAGIVTLALLVCPVVAALLIAHLYKLGVAPTTVAALIGGGTLPTLYLTWAASRVSADPSQRVEPAADQRTTAGAVQQDTGILIPVAQCRPSWLGVHAAIQRPRPTVPGDSTLDDVPAYVIRDHDERLRNRLVEASVHGGFIVLVGGSSVGKTRSLYEAIRAVLTDWRIFIPKDASTLRQIASDLPSRTIVWLDDSPVEEFIGSGTDLLKRTDLIGMFKTGQVRPLVIVDTIWPNRYRQLTSFHATDSERAHDDPYRDAREVLALAGEPIEVPEQFSADECARAELLAASDSRLARAISDTQFGVTQYLAGAPELMSRWQHADVYTKAVVTAAIDAQRLGISAPLQADLLKYSASAYLRERHRATAEHHWFARALIYATDPGKGTTALLLPCSGSDHSTVGTTTGYRVADYVLQRVTRTRFFVPVPAGLWNSCVDYVSNQFDITTLAECAHQRRLYAYAEHFYLCINRNGRRKSFDDLVQMLSEQGRVDELRYIASTGHIWAVNELAWHFYLSGRESELRALATATGHPNAIGLLGRLVAGRGRVDEAIAEVEQMTIHDKSEQFYITDVALPQLLYEFGRLDQLDELIAKGWNRQAEIFKNFFVTEGKDGRDRRGQRTVAPEARHIDGADGKNQLSDQELGDRIRKLHDLVADGDRSAQDELAGLLASHSMLDSLRTLLVTTGNYKAWVYLCQGLRGESRRNFVRFGLNPDSSINTAVGISGHSHRRLEVADAPPSK